MALYNSGERPKGAPQPLDQLIIDSVQIRASFVAIEKAIGDKESKSVIFQSFLIGTVYSVGIKLRKILDKQNGVVSLNNIWSLWYKNDEAKLVLQKLSSEEEVEYISNTLKSLKNSNYKEAWKYLQIVLAHNQETGQFNVKWTDIDKLLCFAVRSWYLLVKATDCFYGFGTYQQWSNANDSLDNLLSDKQRNKMEKVWNKYCQDAEHWKNLSCNE